MAIQTPVIASLFATVQLFDTFSAPLARTATTRARPRQEI